MIQKLTLSSILFLILFVAACKKEVQDGDSIKTVPACEYATDANKAKLVKKWGNTFTQTDNYSSTGSLQSTSTIYPVGYFELNNDATYKVFSNNVPLNGSWTINAKCQLVLDSGKTIQRNFEILSLSKDSLTIRRKQGSLVYTQHYRTFSCPDASKLMYTWNNVYIKTDYITNGTISGYNINYPVGIFKLNANASYNVVSNGVPLNGVWEIDQNNCNLVLDKSTQIERSFEIQLVTTDSLTIRRKDTTNKFYPVYYSQHYKRSN